MVGPNNQFIFLDPLGKRWPRLRILVLLSAVAIFCGTVFFVRTLLVSPRLAWPSSLLQLKARLKALENQPLRPPPAKQEWLRFVRSDPQPGAGGQPAAAAASAEVRLAFTVSWDYRSRRSFAAHAGQFTHVCPEWLTLTDGRGSIEAVPDPVVREIAARRGVVLIPLLRNLQGSQWRPEAVEALASGPAERRSRFCARLRDSLQETGAGGVAIEWSQLDPAYAPLISRLLEGMSETLHAAGMQLWLCVPMGAELKAFDLERLSHCVDYFIAMLHDENGEDDTAGPLVSQEWFEGWLNTVTAYGRLSQWVAAIGSYGYDWTRGDPPAECISFSDVMSRAQHAGLEHCEPEEPGANPQFDYEDAGTPHTVWFLDASTFLNQLREALSRKIGGFALSRLGTEDPAVWDAIRLAHKETLRQADLSPLNPIPADETPAHVGGGEFLTVEENRQPGQRVTRLTKDGMVTMTYERFPMQLTVCHQGQGGPHEVAITFDDGPDARWTPKILDILKSRGVKAAFFVVGSKVENNPEIVERIQAEGHELGVHTYTHPNLAEVSLERARLELNATQRLIEKLTGHSTILFRPPYKADTTPERPDEIAPIEIAQDLGYLTVTNAIDSSDWTRPGADAILRAVKDARGDGNIILMHDAGGDRSQTVQTLPMILDWLYERGDRVVPLSTLLNVPPEQLMPPLPRGARPLSRLFADGAFGVLHTAEELLWAFMIVASALVVLRTLFVAALAAGFRPCHVSEEAGAADAFTPPVSVLMPAYNEEKVIARTLASLLGCEYAGELEIVVVDDGSQDGTAAVVAGAALSDPRVRLIRQPNQGKAAALRNGLAALRHDIVVTLDADTHFSVRTIGRLVGHMRDDRVAAVSGHAKVGNLHTFIARCQDLEYTCAFNLDRRAYHRLNCITVVPGAVSALRRSAILAAGGISDDTLAEDTDLTLCFHRLGYRVVYEPLALAWTEAPETVGALVRQRFRWAFGSLQCLWKHSDLLLNPRYKALGLFSLPSMWVFHILLVLTVPLVDGLLIFSLLFGGGSAVWAYFALFLLMDMILAALACFLEGEPLRKAWICLPMRLLFRPLLSWVVWKAVLKAVKGAWVGWGKLERTGSVAVRPAGRP